jgi:hypothetical protein
MMPTSRFGGLETRSWPTQALQQTAAAILVSESIDLSPATAVQLGHSAACWKSALTERTVRTPSAAALFLAATIVTAMVTPCGYSDDPDPGCCYTIQESKSYKLFVCTVSVKPSRFTWNGTRYQINEAWLERRIKRKNHTKPFQRSWEVTDGYSLCFNMKSKGKALVRIGLDSFFAFEGTGASFADRSLVMWGTIDRIGKGKWIVMLSDNWDMRGTLKFRFAAHRPKLR